MNRDQKGTCLGIVKPTPAPADHGTPKSPYDFAPSSLCSLGTTPCCRGGRELAEFWWIWGSIYHQTWASAAAQRERMCRVKELVLSPHCTHLGEVISTPGWFLWTQVWVAAMAALCWEPEHGWLSQPDVLWKCSLELNQTTDEDSLRFLLSFLMKKMTFPHNSM